MFRPKRYESARIIPVGNLWCKDRPCEETFGETFDASIVPAETILAPKVSHMDDPCNFVTLARVIQLGTTVQFGKSLIISLWFDPVDCHDYPSRGYHVISCVDLLFAIYLLAEVQEEGIIQLGGGHYEKNKDFVMVRHILHNGGRIDIAEDINMITKHGLSSKITQSLCGSSDTSEGSEKSGSFEDYESSGSCINKQRIENGGWCLTIEIESLARVVQLGTTVQFGKSLIISLWFDPMDCHDYPSHGYHVISYVDLLFAIYLPAKVQEEGIIQLGGGHYEKNKDFVMVCHILHNGGRIDIADEAAELKEAESTIPLRLLGIKHAILIEDECQLHSLVNINVCIASGFERSLFN
ncbi:hypothetical protein Tco_0104860 [Tanacetum coccineum]